MEPQRKEWLETVAAACERVLSGHDAGDTDDAHYAALLNDVSELLDRIKAELREHG